jgi:hypothetical protein
MSTFSSTQLKSIILPASLQWMDGSGLKGTDISTITVEAGNQLFRVETDFLVKLNELTMIKYFGTGTEILIRREVRILSGYCFESCDTISSAIFESGSELFRLGECAFAHCSLKSICIPSSVAFLGRSCFFGCGFLENVTFESGIRLKELSECAFAYCVRLKSILVPASVQVIFPDCFSVSRLLSDLRFESGSRL